MVDVLAWLIPAALLAISELVFASRSGREASTDAIAVDHAIKSATVAALFGPALLATMLPGTPPGLVWTGLAIALAGVTLRTIAMVTLKERYRLIPQRQSSNHYLIRSGIYALVRHPGYTGILVALAGLALVAAGAAGLVFMVPVTVLCGVRIAGEERLLREEFSTDFGDYCRAVRWRLVPWLY